MLPVIWNVVLAAGAGRRLASVTGGVPKQFWRGAGNLSLLEQTLHRFEPLAPRSRTVVVVDRSHADYVRGLPARGGEVLLQPSDCGTAAGVMLGLLPVLEADPEGVTVVTPADHGVADQRRFQQSVREAAEHVRLRNRAVLFGVEPASPNTDYGWISLLPDGAGRQFRPVDGFVEKPSADVANGLFVTGAVWNTMVVVVRARVLHEMCCAHVPALASVFDAALRMPRGLRRAYLDAVYRDLTRFDFSRDVLGHAPGLLARVWPSSLGWSDLGTPDRLLEWQRRFGRSAAAPAASVA